MDVPTVLQEGTPDDVVTVVGLLAWLGPEEWTPERPGRNPGQMIPSQPKRRFGLAERMGDKNAPTLWGTYYYRQGDQEIPPSGARISVHGKLYRDQKGNLGISVGGARGWFRYADEAAAEAAHPRQQAVAPRSPQTQPPPQGQARSAPTQAPSGQNTPSGRQTVPLDVDLKLQVHVYRQLDRQFGMLDDLGQPPAAAEIQAMAVSTMISIHRGEVQVPPATMQALLKQQAPGAPVRHEATPDYSDRVADEGGPDDDIPF
jgi:hypothetical protein